MEFWTGIRAKLGEMITSRMNLRGERSREEAADPIPALEEEEMYSCASMLSHDQEMRQVIPEETALQSYKAQQSPGIEPLGTATTTEVASLLGPEEGSGVNAGEFETAFQVRNLTTGEMLDLRDENDPGFAQKYAQVLTLSQEPEGYL